MDDATLQVTARSSPGEGLVFQVEGYLDEDGGLTLAREVQAVPAGDPARIRIDLDAVCLFNCSGARALASALRDLDRQGFDVDLVNVHPALKRALELVA